MQQAQQRERENGRERERVSEGILMLSDTLVIDDTMNGEGHVLKGEKDQVEKEGRSRKRKKKMKRPNKEERQTVRS